MKPILTPTRCLAGECRTTVLRTPSTLEAAGPVFHAAAYHTRSFFCTRRSTVGLYSANSHKNSSLAARRDSARHTFLAPCQHLFVVHRRKDVPASDIMCKRVSCSLVMKLSFSIPEVE